MAKIPDHAKCVYKGKIFEVYEWPQEMFDGSIETFECLKRRPTTSVLAFDGSDIIFSKQEQPGKPEFYSFLGGRCEEGEDPLEGAKRELLEESGLVSDNWKLIRCYNIGGKIDWQVYYYAAYSCRKVAEQKLDSGERIVLMRLPFTQFLREILPQPNFAETEFQAEIMSAFNQAKADALCAEIFGEKHG